MMHLITGGSASGKSAYAEAQAGALAKAGQRKLIYIATMKPFGAEGRQRVEKHRRQRQGKGFETVEWYRDLSDLMLRSETEKSAEEYRKPVVLLECISNLTANELFEAGGSQEEVMHRIAEGIRCLQKQTEHLIIVTNEVFSDGVTYPEETRNYICLLGRINQWLGDQADQVTEVVFGIPVLVKTKEKKTEWKEETGHETA